MLAATMRAEEVTRNNSECILNVALSYTSRFFLKLCSDADHKGYVDIKDCQGRDNAGNKEPRGGCKDW